MKSRYLTGDIRHFPHHRTIEQVRATGVTKTLLGRERPIPDMNSKNPNSRGFAERTAVNSPLQGMHLATCIQRLNPPRRRQRAA